MAKYEVIYKNKKSGVQERCTAEDWERISKHPTLGRSFAIVRKERIPDAAIEAQQAAEEAREDQESKPQTSKRKRKPKNV